jgi:hypothetical protein
VVVEGSYGLFEHALGDHRAGDKLAESLETWLVRGPEETPSLNGGRLVERLPLRLHWLGQGLRVGRCIRDSFDADVDDSLRLFPALFEIVKSLLSITIGFASFIGSHA